MSEPGAPDLQAPLAEATPLRVAFVVDVFPMLSETFIIEQVAQLVDRGVDVSVFAFRRGDTSHVSEKYERYRMWERTKYLDGTRKGRLLSLVPTLARLASRPRVLARSLDARRGRDVRSLKLLYRTAAFANERFDVIHCHFGTTARAFLEVRRSLGDTTPLVTSLYGYDVSMVIKREPRAYYDELKRQCSLFFVMSDDMRSRVIAAGFPPDRVEVHPVSIEVDAYPHSIRRVDGSEPLRLMSVGRFVEKKGFDDLLAAMARVEAAAPGRAHCSIVGGGPLEPEIRAQHEALGLGTTVEFLGYRKLEEILDLFQQAHVFVQPSKTAADGDME